MLLFFLLNASFWSIDYGQTHLKTQAWKFLFWKNRWKAPNTQSFHAAVTVIPCSETGFKTTWIKTLLTTPDWPTQQSLVSQGHVMMLPWLLQELHIIILSETLWRELVHLQIYCQQWIEPVKTRGRAHKYGVPQENGLTCGSHSRKQTCVRLIVW